MWEQTATSKTETTTTNSHRMIDPTGIRTATTTKHNRERKLQLQTWREREENNQRERTRNHNNKTCNCRIVFNRSTTTQNKDKPTARLTCYSMIKRRKEECPSNTAQTNVGTNSNVKDRNNHHEQWQENRPNRNQNGHHNTTQQGEKNAITKRKREGREQPEGKNEESQQ